MAKNDKSQAQRAKKRAEKEKKRDEAKRKDRLLAARAPVPIASEDAYVGLESLAARVGMSPYECALALEKEARAASLVSEIACLPSTLAARSVDSIVARVERLGVVDPRGSILAAPADVESAWAWADRTWLGADATRWTHRERDLLRLSAVALFGRLRPELRLRETVAEKSVALQSLREAGTPLAIFEAGVELWALIAPRAPTATTDVTEAERWLGMGYRVSALVGLVLDAARLHTGTLRDGVARDAFVGRALSLIESLIAAHPAEGDVYRLFIRASHARLLSAAGRSEEGAGLARSMIAAHPDHRLGYFALASCLGDLATGSDEARARALAAYIDYRERLGEGTDRTVVDREIERLSRSHATRGAGRPAAEQGA